MQLPNPQKRKAQTFKKSFSSQIDNRILTYYVKIQLHEKVPRDLLGLFISKRFSNGSDH